MVSNEKILEALQETLTAELTAINQYILHSQMMENWGYEKLAGITKKRAIEEMGHAEALIERILFLEGFPTVNPQLNIQIGQNVVEMFQNDLKAEYEAINQYNSLIQAVQELGDNGTRSLFERHLAVEEAHANYLEGQLTIIEQVGFGNYLATQM